MKKLLSIIGAISLITSGSSNLIACDNSALTSEKLTELKEKNSKIINGNKLEWIEPQEKPFITVDNKYYFVIWLDDKENNWRIIKLKNDIDLYEPSKWKLDESSNYYLGMGRNGIYIVNISRFIKYPKNFNNGDSDKYFKVYRWDGTNEPNIPFISPKTGQIIDWNLKQQNNINSNKKN